jgi:large subunit ribosomal protein L15
MRLNDIRPAKNAKKPKKRVARGVGSLGKTAGRGHTGQLSRSGGYIKPGFEGGQMPYRIRVPKFGFNSKQALRTDEIRLHELNRFGEGAHITLSTLKERGLITYNIHNVKVIANGQLNKALHFHGIKVTRGARQIIEQAGGSIN